MENSKITSPSRKRWYSITMATLLVIFVVMEIVKAIIGSGSGYMTARSLQFLSVIFAVLIILFLGIFRTIIQPWSGNKNAYVASIVSVALLFSLPFLGMMLSRSGGGSPPNFFLIMSFTMGGVLILLATSCLIIYSAEIIYRVVLGILLRKRNSKCAEALLDTIEIKETDESKFNIDQYLPQLPQKWKIARAIISLALTTILTITSISIGFSTPRILVLEVPISRLPKELNGFRITMLSDMHCGPTVGRDDISEIVSVVNELQSDVIAIVGDLTDGEPRGLLAEMQSFATLKAPHGKYFVTGNHEYYYGESVNKWIEEYEKFGIKTLRNEFVSIPENATNQIQFDLAGVDDWSSSGFGHGHGANITKAVDGRNQSRALIVLAHQPKQINGASEVGADLMLSGHVHGGQMFPINLASYLANPYYAGFYKHGGPQSTVIYVSEGVRYWGPPMRLMSRPDITVVVLKSGDGEVRLSKSSIEEIGEMDQWTNTVRHLRH